MRAVDTEILYPDVNTTGHTSCAGKTVAWNLTAGDLGTDIVREDGYCGGIALSEHSYKDVEFRGTFARYVGEDDDWIGFFFGYQDPGNFYLVLAPGDWDTHVGGFRKEASFNLEIHTHTYFRVC